MIRIQRSERPVRALLLIDLQRGVLAPEGPASLGQDRVQPMIRAIREVLMTEVKNGTPVAFIKNEWNGWRFFENWWFNGAFREGSMWSQVDPRLLEGVPAGQVAQFSKSFPSSFSDPNLQVWLEERRVGTLIVAGLFGDQCVTSTALDGIRSGYDVQWIPDGVLTRDPGDLAPALEKLRSKGAKPFQRPE